VPGGPAPINAAGSQAIQDPAVLVATGAEYRRLSLPNVVSSEGAAVYYGVNHVKVQPCAGEEIVIVGGGNRRGRPRSSCPGFAKQAQVLVRGPISRAACHAS
jgi:thioredoxin reductase (NADPH)